MTAAIRAMYVLIMDVISGEKIADRATDFMTGRWVSCISGDAGICWRRQKVRLEEVDAQVSGVVI